MTLSQIDPDDPILGHVTPKILPIEAPQMTGHALTFRGSGCSAFAVRPENPR